VAASVAAGRGATFVADSEGRYFPAPGSETITVQAQLDLVALVDDRLPKTATDETVRILMEFRVPKNVSERSLKAPRPWDEGAKQRVRDYVAKHKGEAE
jgi:hypothetical protein